MCHQGTFANGKCMAINMVVFDEEHEVFSPYILGKKKSLISVSDQAGWLLRVNF